MNSWFSKVVLILTIFFLLLNCTKAATPESTSKEYEIKAAFIANFARFVIWPNKKNNKRLLIFGIIGENPFGKSLEPVQFQSFKGLKGKVVYFHSWTKDVMNADILFISKSVSDELSNILELLNDYPILTISDIKGFAQKGGMIEFIEKDESIRFVINLVAVKKSGLEMNFQLLQLADKVLEK